jgi:predicted small secreted protein
MKKTRKLVAMVLVAMAMSVSAATTAHASGEDAVADAFCDIAYYLYPSYYWDYCDQTSPL